MKTIGILVDGLSQGYKSGNAEKIEHRYKYFLNQGITLVIVSIESFNKKKGIFTAYKSQVSPFQIIEEDIRPEIVWVRTSKDYSSYNDDLKSYFTLFPSSLINTLSRDKRATYNFLKEFQSKTVLMSDAIHDPTLLEDMGDQVVMKPRNGYGGDGVRMVDGKEIKSLSSTLSCKSSEYIVQKKCNFSGGYPGIVEGNHDIRVVYIGGVVAYSTIRSNVNDFRVNVSQGGTSVGLDVANIPPSLQSVADQCIKKLGGPGTGVVGIDFGYDASTSKRVLIEINNSPGFTIEELHTNTEVMLLAYSRYCRYFNAQ